MSSERIGDYEVIEHLGAGGMGVVYKARHRRLGRWVALKRLPPQQSDDAERRKRFLHEARAASALNHPGIVTVHDVIRHGDDDVIVMELVAGESLATHIPPEGLPWRRAAELALDLSRALAAAHAAGVVHRDLKPANVMVTDDPTGQRVTGQRVTGQRITGQRITEQRVTGQRVKILDFGIAKRLPTPAAASDDAARAPETALDLTELGVQPGTPAYMAPEQLLGETVDGRSDIFCFGMLLFEMLTGQRPFRGTNSVAAVDALLHGETPSVRASHPQVPAALDALIGKTLSKEPRHRPQTMDDVSRSLDSLLDVRRLGSKDDTSSRPGPGVHLKAVLVMDWSEATLLGDAPAVPTAPPSLAPPTLATVVRQRFAQHGADELPSSGGCSWALFELPWDAVRCALALHRSLQEHQKVTGAEAAGRIAIHFAEFTVGPSAIDGDIEATARRSAHNLLRLAMPSQTLLSGAAFDLARRGAARHDTDAEQLRWLAHGTYHFSNADENDDQDDDQDVEVFEVGISGQAPLRPPADTAKARRSPSGGTILGWRPAAGLAIPKRPNWVIDRKLGQGGFGEVWLASHAKTQEPRVYKFCYHAERLRSLEREITVFRLLKEELGERQDIARLIDWNLDEAPYFIESAYTEGGSLVEWSRTRGGLDDLDLGERLELLAQVATALEAAHSVGVLHKDVKPANVLITASTDGKAQAVLTDFGIGHVVDPQRLHDRGITALGLSLDDDDPAARSGTQLYMAPELLIGRPPSIQSDLYAFGVMLYQVTVGDLDRPLAVGWERQVEDPLLRQDITDCVDGDPGQRPRSAFEIAERLRSLKARTLAKRSEARALHEAAEAERLATQLDRRQARRRRLWSAIAIAAAGVLAVVSLLAWQAIQARGEAERGRAQAEQMIDFLLGDLHESLERIGRLDLLEQAARGSQEYFDSLEAPQESDDATLKRSLSLLNIGDVLLKQGDTEAAVASYSDAQRLLASQTADIGTSDGTPADDFSWHETLHRAEVKLALAIARQGNTRDAIVRVQAALDRARDFSAATAASSENDSEQRFAISECQYWLCALEDKAGNRTTALDSCRQALDILLPRSADDPFDEPPSLDELAPETLPWRHAALILDTRIRIGGSLRVLKQSNAAFEEFRQARALAERLASDDPSNAYWPQRLAWIHFQTGVLRLFHQHDEEKALRDLTAARLAYQRLSQLDPTQTRWRDNLAETLNLLGRIDLQLRDPEAAIVRFAQAAQLLQGLIDQDPSHRSRLGALARMHQSMGRAQLEIDAVDDAINSFEAAVKLNAHLAEVAGDDPDPQNFLSWSHVVLGDGYARQGDHLNAQKHWSHAVELIAPVTASSDAIEYRDTHVQALLKLGRLEEARPMVESLLAEGWQDASFLQSVHQAGLGDILR